jgi:hypothetical protein
MPAHRINLRGPWLLEQGTDADRRKIRLPGPWEEIFADCSDRVRLTRTFHRPTNLEPWEVVELVFEDWPGHWILSLNQQRLAEFRDASAESPKRIDVTQLLEPTNTLWAETHLEHESVDGRGRGPFGAVSLEIRTN